MKGMGLMMEELTWVFQLNNIGERWGMDVEGNKLNMVCVGWGGGCESRVILLGGREINHGRVLKSQ
jgi:hypothetical protein